MSFTDEFNRLNLPELADHSRVAELRHVRESLAVTNPGLHDFARLISPAAGKLLDELCLRSQQLTRQRFGKTIRLFAPLYLSNECVNDSSGNAYP